MKKELALLLALLIVITPFMGCLGDDDDDDDDDGEDDNYNYADSSLVVSVKWLKDNLEDDDLLIVDARGDDAYNTGHIPGAIVVAWGEFADMSGAPGDEGWGTLLAPAELSTAMAAKGFAADKTIVVYADNPNGWGEDGRIVWMLRMAGLMDSKMLDGGFSHWKAEGYDTTTTATAPTASSFSVTALNASYTITTADLNTKIGAGTIKVVDSRGKDEYDGAMNFGEARGGHLPAAIHISFADVFEANGTFKSQTALEKIFTDAGLAKGDEIAVYCTAGIRSAHLALAMRMAGFSMAKNYDASFYEWAGDKTLSLEPYDHFDTSYVVSAEWLDARLEDDNILIVDARGDDAYNAGHIPGAIVVAWGQFANMTGAPGDEGWGTLLTPAEISTVMAAKGFADDMTIVVYADNPNGWGEDGRIVWMLRMAGLMDSKMLDGGFSYWKAQGYDTTTTATAPTASTFSVTELDVNYTISTSDLNTKIGAGTIKVVDSRGKDEYDGAMKFGEARGGHLPDAILLSFADTLDEDGNFKDQAELETLFTNAGLTKGDEIAVYCTAGIRSAHLAMVMRMAGFSMAMNYDASFYEWAGDRTLPLEPYDHFDTSYVVSAEWLDARLEDDNILIVDARGDDAYNENHIPGAIVVAWGEFADMSGSPGDEGWGTLLAPAELSTAMADKGFDDDVTIVVYANNPNGWGEDGRIVWMLRMAGLMDSKMLDGGFDYWNDTGYTVTKDKTDPVKSDFSVSELDLSYTIGTMSLNETLDSVKVLDSRTQEEYDGATNYGEARGGHIPGAILLSFVTVFNEDGTFKDQAELETLFTEAGLSKDDTIVSYCTAGIRSAHLSLALRMAGFMDSMNYDASFYEWAANENLTVES